MSVGSLDLCTWNWVEELRQARKGKLVGREILFFPDVDSTNQKARDHSLKGAGEGLVILADSQSKGKGRLGRQWQSPPGVNLYASIILRPPVPPAGAQQITLLAGVAGANALARATGLDARIKWPNDIFVHGKKVAGILSEMEAEGPRTRFIILGVGVNVNWQKEDIPPDLREMATSLGAEAGREFSRAKVAAEVFEELEKEYALFLKERFSSRLRDEWNRLSWVNQKWATLTVMDKKYEGQVLGLDTDGALLLVNQEGKIQRFIAGDVSLRL
ncbi:MAG: biotin--[acetyl-CoA-carboxylase] ligase [Thermodesulfobacteriota bacterium]